MPPEHQICMVISLQMTPVNGTCCTLQRHCALERCSVTSRQWSSVQPWTITITEDPTFCFSRLRQADRHLAVSGRYITVVNKLKYPIQCFTEWRILTETFEARAFKIFIEVHSPYSKMSNQALIIIWPSIMRLIRIQRPTCTQPRNVQQTPIFWPCSACKTKSSAQLANIQGAHAETRFACGFKNPV
jgi:hypothetical protein